MTSASTLASFFLFARLAVRMVMVLAAFTLLGSGGAIAGVAGFVIYLLLRGPQSLAQQ
jgi:hypothetical protein